VDAIACEDELQPELKSPAIMCSTAYAISPGRASQFMFGTHLHFDERNLLYLHAYIAVVIGLGLSPWDDRCSRLAGELITRQFIWRWKGLFSSDSIETR